MRLIVGSMISVGYNDFRVLGCWIVMDCDESYMANAPYMHPKPGSFGTGFYFVLRPILNLKIGG